MDVTFQICVFSAEGEYNVEIFVMFRGGGVYVALYRVTSRTRVDGRMTVFVIVVDVVDALPLQVHCACWRCKGVIRSLSTIVAVALGVSVIVVVVLMIFVE